MQESPLRVCNLTSEVRISVEAEVALNTKGVGVEELVLVFYFCC